MTWWRWLGLAGCGAGIAVAMLLHPGGKRAGLRAVVSGIAMYALALGVTELADAIGGTLAFAGALALAVIAGVFGRTPLGVFNFLVLQWFGVRLARDLVWAEPDGTQVTVCGDDERSIDRIAAGVIEQHGARSHWALLRWIWPLTGWWSAYRWIARRPTPPT